MSTERWQRLLTQVPDHLLGVPYRLPPGDQVREQWWACENVRQFRPNQRQMILMALVAWLREQGVEYNDEIRGLAAAVLRVPAADLSQGAAAVQGGDFGMELYCAGSAVRAVRSTYANLLVARALSEATAADPALGALVLGDFKLTRACVLEKVESDFSVRMQARRGKLRVLITAGATTVAYGMDRAREKSHRAAGFAGFIAERLGAARASELHAYNFDTLPYSVAMRDEIVQASGVQAVSRPAQAPAAGAQAIPAGDGGDELPTPVRERMRV